MTKQNDSPIVKTMKEKGGGLVYNFRSLRYMRDDKRWYVRSDDGVHYQGKSERLAVRALLGENI